MTRTVVHLLRHGEVHNPTGILYGRIPGFRLSERGQKQALTVAEHLADHDIVHVVASPLDRAQQTAAPIADSHRLELATDDRLIEADNQFEGLKVAVGDGALRSPQHWPKLVNPFRPSWGEPYRALAAVLIAQESVSAVQLRPRGGLDVQVSDLGSFAGALPTLARTHDLTLFELSPSDESLESVFSYLVAR